MATDTKSSPFENVQFVPCSRGCGTEVGDLKIPVISQDGVIHPLEIIRETHFPICMACSLKIWDQFEESKRSRTATKKSKPKK